MPTVYSYIRFSDRKQLKGDSIRRQSKMGADWMARHPEHSLDTTLKLKDFGKSAFHGHNLDPQKGDLGKFCALAKAGKIKRGSILMLENIDRFSRQPAMKVAGIVSELVEAGVRVLTLDPEEITDHTNINDMGRTLSIVLRLQLAYEESRKKSERNLRWWEGVRAKAVNGEIVNKRSRSWLTWNKEKRQYDLIPGAAKTIKHIFKRTVEGWGEHRIIEELAQKDIPSFGHSTRWNSAFVGNLIRDRAVLGEWVPYSFQNGKRVPVSGIDPIKDFYPKIIDESLWLRAQAARKERYHKRGVSKGFCNLFAGILYNTRDGHKIHEVSVMPNGKGTQQRRLVSYGHIRKIPGSDGLTLNYPDVESVILNFLREIKASDLLDADDAVGSELAALQGELSGVEGRLSQLQEKLETAGNIETLLKAVSSLETRRAELKKRLLALEQSHAVQDAKPITETQSVIELLDSTTGSELEALRLKLRGMLAAIIESIWILPYKAAGRVAAFIQICFKSGQQRVLALVPGPKQTLRQWPLDDGTVPPERDLRLYRTEVLVREQTNWHFHTILRGVKEIKTLPVL